MRYCHITFCSAFVLVLLYVDLLSHDELELIFQLGARKHNNRTIEITIFLLKRSIANQKESYRIQILNIPVTMIFILYKALDTK